MSLNKIKQQLLSQAQHVSRLPLSKNLAEVYRVLNCETGQVYIGSSQNLKKRLAQHFNQSRKLNARLSNSIKKIWCGVFSIHHFRNTRPKPRRHSITVDFC